LTRIGKWKVAGDGRAAKPGDHPARIKFRGGGQDSGNRARRSLGPAAIACCVPEIIGDLENVFEKGV
jgi:hypothetical protein